MIDHVPTLLNMMVLCWCISIGYYLMHDHNPDIAWASMHWLPASGKHLNYNEQSPWIFQALFSQLFQFVIKSKKTQWVCKASDRRGMLYYRKLCTIVHYCATFINFPLVCFILHHIAMMWTIHGFLSTTKLGDNVLDSICPSVHPFDCLCAKSNKSHYQSKVFVCGSVISGRMRIIAQMRSIGF